MLLKGQCVPEVEEVQSERTVKKSKWAIVRALKYFISLKYEVSLIRKITKSRIDSQFEIKNMPRRSMLERLNLETIKENNDSKIVKEDTPKKKKPMEEQKSLPAFDNAVTELNNNIKFAKKAAIGGRKAIHSMNTYISKSKSAMTRSKDDDEHIINKKDQYGRRPIDIAAQHGNVDVIKFLLDRKCIFVTKMEEESKEINFPLFNACRWNHLRVIEFF